VYQDRISHSRRSRDPNTVFHRSICIPHHHPRIMIDWTVVGHFSLVDRLLLEEDGLSVFELRGINTVSLEAFSPCFLQPAC
jgi:hypothetical protein